MYMAVAILRVQEGLDFSKVLGSDGVSDTTNTTPRDTSFGDLTRATNETGEMNDSVKNYSQQISQGEKLL